MDYEKAYLEAVKRAKAGKPMDEVFPELKESKDERIRKEILALVKKYAVNHERCQMEAYLGKQKEHESLLLDLSVEDVETIKAALRVSGLEFTSNQKVYDKLEKLPASAYYFSTIGRSELYPDGRVERHIIGYLEKQKDNKVVPRVLPCSAAWFEDGEEIEQREQKSAEWAVLQKAFVNSKKDYTLEEKCDASDYADTILPTSVTYGENDEEYKLHKIIEAAFIAGKKMAQKPAEWNDEEAKMLTSAIAFVAHSPFNTIGKGKNNVIAWLKSFPERFNPQPKQGWSEEDENMKNHVLGYLNGFSCSEEAKQEMWKWINSLSERLTLQPKQEWSDEDKDIINEVASILINDENRTDNKREEARLAYLAERIQSLRPQPHWKPSEEQMEALMRTITWLVEKGNHTDSSTLADLRCNLQKLM